MRQFHAILYSEPEINLSRIPTTHGAKSRSEWTKIQQMYENVHPNLALVLSFGLNEVECGKFCCP